MERQSIVLQDDDIEVTCDVSYVDALTDDRIYILDIWSLPKNAGKNVIAENVGSFIVTESQIEHLHERVAQARGWEKTGKWFSGKSLPPDVPIEAE